MHTHTIYTRHSPGRNTQSPHATADRDSTMDDSEKGPSGEVSESAATYSISQQRLFWKLLKKGYDGV